ncbi:hypothetical protein SRHO_G00204840 [Serrasalmus rhombeus]
MERERGGKARAQRQAPKPQLQQQPCLCLPLPFLSPHFTKQGNWPGTLPSSAINQRERRGVVCASVCVCVLIESWRGRGWWYGDQDLPTKLKSSPSERMREGGRLTDEKAWCTDCDFVSKRETKRTREIRTNRAEHLDGSEMERDRVGREGERERGRGQRKQT